MSLPTDRDARNAIPVWDGCVAYFPDTFAEIAKVSVAGNKQYQFGALKWNREVSTDHANKVMRHMLDHQAGNVIDTDGTFHLAKAAWRCLAALQLAIEAERNRTEVPLNEGTACCAAVASCGENLPHEHISTGEIRLISAKELWSRIVPNG